MRLLSIFFIFVLNLSASNLLTYNIYERSDRVDIMLSFDSPYEGRIYQKRGENITILTLGDLTYDKLLEKNINSPILQALSIAPEKDEIKVTLKSDKNIAVIASKTVDGFGLRIRAKLIELEKASSPTPAASNATNTKPTPSYISPADDIIDARYISVVGVLLVLFLFMLWLKNRVKNSANNLAQNKKSWLFNPKDTKGLSGQVSVLHRKPIDQTNSVVLLEFQGKKYLVMTGSSNLLLEKFGAHDIEDSSDFEKAFEENRKKLDDFLKLQDNGLSSYKSKASGDFKSTLESF